MAMRPHPKRADVDPNNLKGQAWSTDDRAGFIVNQHKLHWEMQWSGQQLIRTGFLVAEPFLDTPAPFLQTLILPPDPDPLFNTRPEPYTIDETDWRVTQDGEIRETQDGALRVTQPSQTEAESESTD